MRTDMIELMTPRPEHIPAIAAIEAECFSDPWPEALLSRMRGRITAAVEGDAVLGYLVFSSVLDEGSVDNIAVGTAHRRRGAADMLVADAIEKARAAGLSFITLEVRASNAPAIALYEKHGFREVGRRRGYYTKPKEDAILMTLTI